MASFLDKLMEGISPNATSIRPMGPALLGSATLRAAAYGHVDSDVEHFMDVLLDLIDIRRALEAGGTHPDDAKAVVDQLLDERPSVKGSTEPVRTPRWQAVHDLATRGGSSAAVVITSAAAALPRELAFLRKPLERAAVDVAPLYDGALSAAGGHLTFAAWDERMRACMGTMQKINDTYWKTWTMGSRGLFVTILVAKRYHSALEASGINVMALLDEMNESFKTERMRSIRPPPDGYTAGIGVSLFAMILRAEHYAARSASNVQMRHALKALHDELDIAPWVERVARVLAPDFRDVS